MSYTSYKNFPDIQLALYRNRAPLGNHKAPISHVGDSGDPKSIILQAQFRTGQTKGLTMVIMREGLDGCSSVLSQVTGGTQGVYTVSDKKGRGEEKQSGQC